MASELENARKNIIRAAFILPLKHPTYLQYKLLFFHRTPALFIAQNRQSSVRCLFNISFHHHLKAHSSVFYLQQVAQTQLTHRILPLLIAYHNHPCTMLHLISFLLVFPTTPITVISSHFCTLNLDFFWVKRKHNQRLETNSFLEETGSTQLPRSHVQWERQDRVSQAIEENEETSLSSYTPQPAFDKNRPDCYLVWHSYLQVLCVPQGS